MLINVIKKAKRVVRELTWLVLEIGTLLAVVKMVAQNLHKQQKRQGEGNPTLPLVKMSVRLKF